MTQYICIGYADGAWYSFAHGEELPNFDTKAVAVALVESEQDQSECDSDDHAAHAALVIDALEATGKWKLGKGFRRPLTCEAIEAIEDSIRGVT